MRVEIINGRGNGYAAEIIGRHPQYKLARRFLTMAETGFRQNCYVGLASVEDVPVGTLVEVQTANYKGATKREWFRVVAEGTEKLTEVELMTAVADMPMVEDN